MAARAELGNANFVVGLDSTDLEQGLRNARSAVEQQTQAVRQNLSEQEQSFTSSHRSIRQTLEESGISLENFHHALTDITQIALGFTVANTFGGVFRQIGEAMASASEASRRLGEDVEKLTAITGASSVEASKAIAVWGRFGISAGEVELSFTSLSRAINAFNNASASGGSGAAGAKVIDELNIALKDALGNALPLTVVINEVFDALNKVPDAATRNYDATVLLGRSWQDVARLIKEGSSGLAELAASMGDSAVLTDEQVEKNHQWSLAISGMQAAFHNLSLTLGDVLSGPMTRLATDIGSMVLGWEKNKDGVNAWKSSLDDLVTAMEAVGASVLEVIKLFDQLNALKASLAPTPEQQAQGGLLGQLGTAIAGSQYSIGQPTTPVPSSAAPAGEQELAPGTPYIAPPAPATGADAYRQYQRQTLGLPQGSPVPEAELAPRTPAPFIGPPYVPPAAPPAERAGEAAPRVTPPVPEVGPPSTQISDDEAYAAALKASGISAGAQKTALADLLAAQKANDQELIKQNNEVRTALEARAKESSKFEIEQLDVQLAAAKYAYQQENLANEEKHKAELATIAAEKAASDEKFKGQTQAAQDARDLESRHAGDTHDSDLETIRADTEAAKKGFAERRADVTEDKDVAIRANTEKHDNALAQVQDEVQKTRETRLAADQKLQEGNLREDQADRAIHQGKLDRIREEGQAKLDSTAAALKADQEAAATAQRAIQDETFAYNQQHADRLKAIQDESRTEAATHKANLDAIASEQQATTDAHNLRLEELQDQGKELDTQHTKALQAIADQAAAEAAARQQQLDDLDEAQKAQTAAIDAQIAGIKDAAAAAANAAQDVAQSSTLSTAQANLQHDTAPGAGGDPTKIISDAQAVAAAQAAIDATVAKRKETEALAALDLQKKTIAEIADAERKAIADQAARELAQRQADTRALNDQLANQKTVLAAQTEAENTAFQTRIRLLQDETAAENRRFDGVQAALQKSTEAENNAAQEFAAAQRLKAQAVQDTLKRNTDALALESAAEKKTMDDATKGENARYQTEQESIATTRKLAADKLAVERLTQDETFTAETNAANTAYKSEQLRISETYDDPKTGLFAQLSKAETESTTTLQARTTAANLAYRAEQLRIKETYDGPREDGQLALLPSIAKARDDAQAGFAARTLASNTAYDTEKARITDVYQSIDPNHLGIIPAIEKAKNDNQTALAAQVLAWQKWATDSNAEIQKVIDKLDDLHKKQSNPPPAAATAAPAGGGGGVGGTSGGGAGGTGRGRYGEESLSRAQWGSDLEKEFGVDTRDAACGPLALEGLLQAGGQNSDLSLILKKAAARGWWSTADGMESADDFARMASEFGMPIQGITKASAIADLERGVPIVINTPKHYFLAQGYDPATGLFDMGNSGLSVFNKRYMTLEEAQGFGGGPVRDFFEPLDTAGVSGTPARAASGDGILWDGVSLSGPVAGAAAPAPRGTYSLPAPPDAAAATVADYIRQAAILRGINPDIALRVANSEGGLDTDRRGTFSTGSSWWPFQLHYGGLGTPYEYLGTQAGMGNDFTAQTGFKPGDAAAWEASIDYALDHALTDSWSKWYGAAGVGIGPWEGLPAHAEGGTIDRLTMLVDMSTGKPYGTAGERGEELIIPKVADSLVNLRSEQPAALSGIGLAHGIGTPGGGVPPPVQQYHFSIVGPAMDQVSAQIRREFERSTWLHQGWR